MLVGGGKQGKEVEEVDIKKPDDIAGLDHTSFISMLVGDGFAAMVALYKVYQGVSVARDLNTTYQLWHTPGMREALRERMTTLVGQANRAESLAGVASIGLGITSILMGAYNLQQALETRKQLHAIEEWTEGNLKEALHKLDEDWDDMKAKIKEQVPMIEKILKWLEKNKAQDMNTEMQNVCLRLQVLASEMKHRISSHLYSVGHVKQAVEQVLAAANRAKEKSKGAIILESVGFVLGGIGMGVATVGTGGLVLAAGLVLGAAGLTVNGVALGFSISNLVKANEIFSGELNTILKELNKRVESLNKIMKVYDNFLKATQDVGIKEVDALFG